MRSSRRIDGDRVRQAIRDEAAQPPSLLPSRHIESTLGGQFAGWIPVVTHTPSFEQLAQHCSGAFATREPPRERIVSASKSSKAMRPVHLLSFEDRLLYRVLVGELNDGAVVPDRSHEAFTKFQSGPTALDEYKYLVRTDVVSCYAQALSRPVAQSCTSSC